MSCDKRCWKRSLFPSFLLPLNQHLNALTAWHNSAIIITPGLLLGQDRSQIGSHHGGIMLTNNNFVFLFLSPQGWGSRLKQAGLIRSRWSRSRRIALWRPPKTLSRSTAWTWARKTTGIPSSSPSRLAPRPAPPRPIVIYLSNNAVLC